MEGEALDMFLTIVVPASVGVGIVVATVALVFWYGAGRQTSYEDAVKARQGHAEKEIRKQAEQREKEQKLKREKKRGGERKRKQDVAAKASHVESTPQLPSAQKSILKSNKPDNVVKEKANSTPASRVDFELSATPVKSSKAPRTNPPTPHPSAQRSSLHPLVHPSPEDVEEKESVSRAPVRVDPQKGSYEAEDRPKPKQKVASQPMTTPTKTTAAPGGSSRGQKKAKKSKPAIDPGTMEALPASRIFDIVNSSLLSDEEIQQLIDQLLEMMDANAEWQGTSKGTESVKSLKRTNEDLQSRCKEAEKTVQAHYSKIKDLRAEIQREQTRRQTSESQLQSKINKQSGEITIFKTKITGLEEELKQTKQLSSSHSLQKLEEENSTLTVRMTNLVQENSSLGSQLATRNKALQEAQEQSTRLNAELRRAKTAAKSPTGEVQGHLERMGELEGHLRQVEEDKASLESALKSVETEKDRLAEKVEGLADIARERDGQLSTMQQQLQEAQLSVQALEEKESEVEEERMKLCGEIQQLRAENSQLGSQVEGLQQQSLQQQGPTCSQEQVEDMKCQLQATHVAEKNALVAELEAKRASEVEEVKLQLQAAHTEEQRTLAAELEAKRSSEVMGLKAQYEAELLGVKEELARVQRTGEEEKTCVEQQLATEVAKKQELHSELETLKKSPISTQLNGPVEDQVDAAHEEVLRVKDEELEQALQERDDLKDRLKLAESKLSDVQGKNNTLRDNCWKARDDSAKMQKESEAKLKQVYKETENHVKAAEAKVCGEKEEGQRALLQRLFPDVTVDDTTSFPVWADTFETQAQLTLDNTKKQLHVLTERVEELEQNEQTYIQETTRFRDTLNLTLRNLAELQAQVTKESTEHVRLMAERDEMLQRERLTNRELQQQLSKEVEAAANLQKAGDREREERVRELEERLEETVQTRDTTVQEVNRLTASLDQMTASKTKADETIGQKAGDREQEERVRELEERLEETVQTRDTTVQEVDRLTASLDQMTASKTKADETIGQLESRCEELEKKLREAEESSVELGKIGQSITAIPSDSTEV